MEVKITVDHATKVNLNLSYMMLLYGCMKMNYQSCLNKQHSCCLEPLNFYQDLKVYIKNCAFLQKLIK